MNGFGIRENIMAEMRSVFEQQNDMNQVMFPNKAHIVLNM